MQSDNPCIISYLWRGLHPQIHAEFLPTRICRAETTDTYVTAVWEMADDLGDEWWTQGDNSGNIDKHLQLYFAGNVI